MSELTDTDVFAPRSERAPALALWRIAPLLCAAAYPFLSQFLSRLLIATQGSASPDGFGLWFGVAGSLLLGAAIMALAFASARATNDFRSRVAAHLAFATPS